MKQQKILILLLAGIILAGGAIAFLLKDNTPPKDRAKEVAEKALLASVDCPETVKILAVSTPDSVFGREDGYLRGDDESEREGDEGDGRFREYGLRGQGDVKPDGTADVRDVGCP